MTWKIEKKGHFHIVYHPNGMNQFAFLREWEAEKFVEQQPQ